MTDERISDARALIRHLRVRGRLVRRGGKEAGSDPGTLVHTGRRRVENVRYWLFEYDKATVEERRPDSVPDCFPFAGPNLTTWLNVDGLHEVDQLRDLGERAHLHPLVMEDVVSIGQRPKVENYDHQLYIVLRALEYDDRNDEISEDQISIVLAQDFVLSFQEQPGDSFDPIRDRLRTGKGALRERGADFLAYSLVDAVVDDYFVVLEKVGDRLEELENEVMTAATHETINKVHHLKRELIVMRKAVWPLRDVLNSLVRDETALITPQTRIFLRDAYDHAVQVIDTVETMRDLVAGMVDLYLSAISNRANEVMKVLTIIATIFIPLTFVVGIYGMNFDYMPELRWRWGYPAVMLFMAIVAAGMLVFFRRKRWI